jgi:hypothetical protein
MFLHGVSFAQVCHWIEDCLWDIAVVGVASTIIPFLETRITAG